jgi:peptidoglycan/xylan/chitin deacetylase (PgdA/CDA1 family)
MEKDIDYLGTHYNFITLEQLIKFDQGKAGLPENPILLTFDDGFCEMYDIVVPLLLKKGIPTSFFITASALDNKQMLFRNKSSVLIDFLKTTDSKNLENNVLNWFTRHDIHSSDAYQAILGIRYANRELLDELALFTGFSFGEYLEKNHLYLTTGQIKEMIGHGFETGAHSVDHPNFSELTTDERHAQISKSLDFLSDKNILTHRAFAFPFSSNMADSEFLTDAYNRYKLEITFGTNGMVPEKKPHHYQRFYMDFNYGSINYHVTLYQVKGLVKQILAR